MIQMSFKRKGSKTEEFLSKALNFSVVPILQKYGEIGVDALSAATPVDTGKTASSWTFRLGYTDGRYSITWLNTNVAAGYAPIAVLLDSGHATGNGGYVQGKHFIEPALKGVFEQIASDAWAEVTRS